jgi:hypothetical protein
MGAEKDPTMLHKNDAQNEIPPPTPPPVDDEPIIWVNQNIFEEEDSD